MFSGYFLLLLSTCCLIYVTIVSCKTQHNRCTCLFRILQCNESVKLRMRAPFKYKGKQYLYSAASGYIDLRSQTERWTVSLQVKCYRGENGRPLSLYRLRCFAMWWIKSSKILQFYYSASLVLWDESVLLHHKLFARNMPDRLFAERTQPDMHQCYKSNYVGIHNFP